MSSPLHGGTSTSISMPSWGTGPAATSAITISRTTRPKMFEDTSMVNIRMASRFKDAELGERVPYITVSRKLHPITKLSGMKFLSAWWHIVVCHYSLWGQNFHHRDVNPSNLMVYKSSDLPFVAIELLTKGKIKHLYRHDAESFIWVLTWVCLRYREGTLLNKARQLDRWL
ncbi:hypothetical protein BDR04DRAFT_242129 [Suillus decipiens]|nr:hypothetical protein BDR04DRAFT_242129 [Suillus decipiens]